MALPKDVYMLLSVVNMKLRDSYPDLDALCDDLEENPANIAEKLAGIGYVYDKKINQFIKI